MIVVGFYSISALNTASAPSLSRQPAETIAEVEADKIRKAASGTPEERAKHITVTDCLDLYTNRPGGLEAYDLVRVAEFNTMIGNRALSDIQDAWAEWLSRHGSQIAPATAARWRAILQAALNVGTKRHKLPAIRLPLVHQPEEERVVYLAVTEQDRLLASYNEHARRPMALLCFGGLRTQECPRQDWRNIDWTRSTIFVPKSKSGKARTVPLHPRVIAEIEPVWVQRGRPESGPVFLSVRGEPYSDTANGRGGNPLSKAHMTACRCAEIDDFRVHDWRHHWASRLVMSGCDLFTLMKLGGWATPRMVQKYASVSVEHLSGAVSRLVQGFSVTIRQRSLIHGTRKT